MNRDTEWKESGRGEPLRKPKEASAVHLRRLQYGLHPEQGQVHEAIPVGLRSDGSPLTVDLYLPATITTKQDNKQLPMAFLLHGLLPDFISIGRLLGRYFETGVWRSHSQEPEQLYSIIASGGRNTVVKKRCARSEL